MGDDMTGINPSGESPIALGSGYNALLEFDRFEAFSDIPCIVHDDDLFVAAILSRYLELIPIDNIRVDGSDMRRIEFGPHRLELFCLTSPRTQTPIRSKDS